jgi:Domain of unknown function (DUF4123)/FHA domain
LEAGSSARVGRSALADVTFSHDTHMSGVHFVVECDEQGCVLRDLNSSNGTLVNGARVSSALLSAGDTVVAGETIFFVGTVMNNVEAPPAPAVDVPVASTPQEKLLAMLRGEFQPLYALLDAANEPSVLKVLFESKEEYASLFDGVAGAQLTHFAPYLVRLPKESPLLETLVQKGWGKSWGVFLTSPQQLQDLRSHFRQFLLVTMPDGKEVYFRFYDPRVLRVYLPSCVPDEINSLFGPVKYYLVEDDTNDVLLRFSNKGCGVGRKMLPLVTNPSGPAPLLSAT